MRKTLLITKSFGKQLPPFLPGKVLSTKRITLIENDKIINNDNETVNIMNTFLYNIMINVNVPEYHDCESISGNISDTILKAIVKYRIHSSIKAFLLILWTEKKPLRKLVVWITQKYVKNQIYPQKLLIKMLTFFQKFFIGRLMLQSMKESFHQFSNWLTLPQFFKKGLKNSKDNYRPISILKNLSRVFENIMYKQMATFMDKYFSKFQCGFRKGYSTQLCLIPLIGKCKSAVDSRKFLGALLKDLSKTFDCLPHELLLAKSNAYGLSLSALRFICS